MRMTRRRSGFRKKSSSQRAHRALTAGSRSKYNRPSYANLKKLVLCRPTIKYSEGATGTFNDATNNPYWGGTSFPVTSINPQISQGTGNLQRLTNKVRWLRTKWRFFVRNASLKANTGNILYIRFLLVKKYADAAGNFTGANLPQGDPATQSDEGSYFDYLTVPTGGKDMLFSKPFTKQDPTYRQRHENIVIVCDKFIKLAASDITTELVGLNHYKIFGCDSGPVSVSYNDQNADSTQFVYQAYIAYFTPSGPAPLTGTWVSTNWAVSVRCWFVDS